LSVAARIVMSDPIGRFCQAVPAEELIDDPVAPADGSRQRQAAPLILQVPPLLSRQDPSPQPLGHAGLPEPAPGNSRLIDLDLH